jgi:ParB family transcriptional regulator, chromosome partitioning protein
VGVVKFPALNHLPTKGVALSDIYVGERFRPADPNGVLTLSLSLEADGLMAPIGVRENGNQNLQGKYTLVWGLHRLEAAKKLEWAQIEAKIVPAGGEWTPERLSELEALENLARADLAPFDRAATVVGLLKGKMGEPSAALLEKKTRNV